MRGSSCFICGKPFDTEAIPHEIEGMPAGYQATVDKRCFDRIGRIASEQQCSDVEALLILSARVREAFLGRGTKVGRDGQ